MNYRFKFRRFVLLSMIGIVFLLVLTHDLRGQESQGSAQPPPQAAAKNSKTPEIKDDKNQNIAALTREYVALSKTPPQITEKVEIPNASFIREWYRVEWRMGDPFYLFVIRPKGVTAKTPVILYLPSFPDDIDLFQNNSWCTFAVQGGYSVVGFVGNVTAHRTRYRLLKEWFVSEMPEALTSTTHDVQLILDYLSTRGDMDMDHVAMYGSGSGGSIAILASVVDSRIKVLDLLAPWGDWKTWANGTVIIPEDERATYRKPEFLATVSGLDPVEWLPKIQAKSIRIEDIRGNKAMPDKAQEKLEAAAPDFALIDQYGNGRAFLATQASISILSWVKSQLGPTQQPVPLEKSARIHFIPAMQPKTPENLPNFPVSQSAKTPTASKESDKEKQNQR
jgi:hypothetical protein